MFPNNRLDKLIMIYLYNGILYSNGYKHYMRLILRKNQGIKEYIQYDSVHTMFKNGEATLFRDAHFGGKTPREGRK